MPRPSNPFTPAGANNHRPDQDFSARSNSDFPPARTPRPYSSSRITETPQRSSTTVNNTSSATASRVMDGRAADKANRQIEWLNQRWEGRGWLPEDVRRAQRNRGADHPSAVVVSHMVKITKLAQLKNVPLPCLWDDTSPQNYLRKGVMGGLHAPRLTGETAGFLYDDMKFKLGSDVDDTGESESSSDDDDDDDDDGDIEDQTPRASNALKLASDSAVKNCIDVTEEPRTPSNTTIKSDARYSTARPSTPAPLAHTLLDAKESRTASAPPQPSVAGPSYLDQCHAAHDLKRKREGDDSAIEGPSATKHCGSASFNAKKLQEQLTHDVKFTDDVLSFLTNIFVACHSSGMDQGKVRVADPLWFNIHDENGLPSAIQRFDQFNIFCFPIHHKNPTEHWSLGVVHITPGRMAFDHHDSAPDPNRYQAVKSRFQEWARYRGFRHDLAFKRMTCPRQKDSINCGVHVLACLRRELKNEPCPPTFNATEEKQSIIRFLKTADEGKHSGYHLDILREFKKLFVEEEQEKFFNELRNATSASLDANCKAAEMRRDDARDELKVAEEVLKTLLVKESTLIEARDRTIQALGIGDIDSAADTFQLDHPKKSIGMSQQEVLDSTISDVGFLIRHLRCNAANAAKQALEQHRQDVMEQMEVARKDIMRKKSELMQAEALVGRITLKRQMKQDIEGFSLMGPEIFNGN
ncbi:hypothetical protein FSARC_2612 [Fusarium sarcochroum]|uniref:Ubiquitin-like protease family profile domain-containing protein n=1 Tax=Fusarium sarcochroum TaxID=1208366 RepID=A0A8H4U5R9_9HYPO|nr:hypothetical protein FSARC_2612 [Fusarium sarcochroum]